VKNKRLKFCVLLLSGFGLTGLHAQEVIPAAGGNASGSGGSQSFTVGQIAYHTNTGTNGLAEEGVQQPYEISQVTAIEEAKGTGMLVSIYPNPANDFLTLSINEFDISNLSYQLYDMNGNLLQNQKITSNQTKIAMSKLVTAIYFVKVFQKNKEVKTFKIIKK
jgi:hypothetical protein